MKRLFYIILITILVLSTACQKESQQEAKQGYQEKTDSQYSFFNGCGYGNRITQSPDGYYFQTRKGMVYYIDEQSGEWINICGKPECRHQGEVECAGWVKGMFGLTYMDGKLYYQNISSSIVGTEQQWRGEIYSMDVNGMNRKLEAYIPCGVGIEGNIVLQPEQYLIHRGKVYYAYTTWEDEVGTVKFESVPLGNPGETPKVILSWETEVDVSYYLRAYEDCLYTHMYYNDQHQVISVNINTGEVLTLETEKPRMSISAIADGKIYFIQKIMNGTEEEGYTLELWQASADFEEKKKINQDVQGQSRIAGDNNYLYLYTENYIVVKEEEDGIQAGKERPLQNQYIYIYDFSGNLIGKVDMSEWDYHYGMYHVMPSVEEGKVFIYGSNSFKEKEMIWVLDKDQIASGEIEVKEMPIFSGKDEFEIG